MIAMPKCNKIEVLAVLKQVRVDPELKPLKDWLQLNLDHFRAANDAAEGVRLHQQQGACQAFDGLLTLIENSPVIMEKVGNAKPGQIEPVHFEALSPGEYLK